MTANNIIVRWFTYPVIRLDDTPFTRRLHRLHVHFIEFCKLGVILFPALLILYLLMGFYLPTKIAFATNTQNCAFAPSLLPRLTSASPTDHYRVTMPSKLSVNGYPLLSTRMCVEPTAVPTASGDTVVVKQFGLPISKKLSIMNVASLSATPRIKNDTVSTKTKLIFELSKPDHFFSYSLVVADKSVDCLVQGDAVSCPTSELGLEQGEPYVFTLKQMLGSSSQSLFSNEFTTITSVDLINSTITAGQVVYDTPTSVQLTLSKTLVRANDVKIYQDTTVLSSTHTLDDKFITITLAKPLERQKAHTLYIGSATAEDGGYLEEPITINFTTSGGPKVVGSSLPSSKATTSVDFTLTFDHSLKTEQDFSSSVALSSGGKLLPATFSASGTQLRIRAKTALSSCTDFSITIKETLTSEYGVSGGNAYSANSRTQCSRTFSIGTSVEGRDITAYSIGSGPDKVLFIGTIHGNEKSAFYLLNSWLDHLEANPGAIPSNKTIIIIPKLNPDGFAANSRYNAHNVDLNRNFASANWKADVKVPGGSILTNGGGTSPLSEPESKAIVDYITSVGPSLVMSYHSQGSMVIGNGSGNSLSLASMYAGHVGYENVSPEASTGAFEHDTTGALEDWLHETPNIPVVLLELSSHTTNSIFPYHKQPMLNVIK